MPRTLRPSTRRRPPLSLHTLEDRTVPAVVASFASGSGTLTIDSDTDSDTITVQLDGGQIGVFQDVAGIPTLVTVTNAPAAGLTPSSLTGGIVVNAGAGDDSVEISEKIKVATTLNGGTGADTLLGGAGKDQINTGTDAVGDYADGRGGDDSISGGDGDDVLIGGAGNDTIAGGNGVNNLDGGDGNDSITGGASLDYIVGGKGKDTIAAGDGDDTVFGGGGDSNDTMADSLDGGKGDDYLDGGKGKDTITGGVGNDTIEGGDGNDSLTGGDEADPLGGLTDNDVIYGGAGNDAIAGGWGDDALYGEAGNDSITGGAGQDTLNGSAGKDVLVGHGANASGNATDAANFDIYQEEFDLTKAATAHPKPGELQPVELNLGDTIAALTAAVNTKAGLSVSSRIRYLGSGEFLVKLGDVNGTDLQKVHFDGTYSDNDIQPVVNGKSELWALLLHRARMQFRGGVAYDPYTFIDQATYNTWSVSPGDAASDLTGRSPTQASPYTFVGQNPPAGFAFTDIANFLKQGAYLTVSAVASPDLGGIEGGQSYAITKVSTVKGVEYITLYNSSGHDQGTANAGATLDETGKKKDDGFITIKATEFFDSLTFAKAYSNLN